MTEELKIQLIQAIIGLLLAATTFLIGHRRGKGTSLLAETNGLPCPHCGRRPGDDCPDGSNSH